ncbi:hypothetical protein HPP92_016089 [Vanilla planifolia]|uniref:Uncharacterized protein n=1 Tax=Vanilla planifolia TaxID=51239 RepID=A0A835QMZ4_VANPL|nr:hypothetical protein HPP92_016089 [Vanilla planifolia]
MGHFYFGVGGRAVDVLVSLGKEGIINIKFGNPPSLLQKHYGSSTGIRYLLSFKALSQSRKENLKKLITAPLIKKVVDGQVKVDGQDHMAAMTQFGAFFAYGSSGSSTATQVAPS